MDPLPGESSIDALNTATQNLADETMLANIQWSGYGKMIYHPGELIHMKDLLHGRVTI